MLGSNPQPDRVTILLVEDDDVQAEAVMRTLQREGIGNRVVHAEDGRQALQILRGEHPESRIHRPYFIILDLNMPGMNGFEFLDVLRADVRFQNDVVFVLTTSDDERDRAAAYAHNVAGYIVKPDLGPGLRRALEMLESYWSTVLLPT